MSIHLLQNDTIKDRALLKLLKNEGFEVEKIKSDKKETQKKFRNQKPTFILIDVDFLSKFKGSEIQELCNEYYQIILLGPLTKFYWLFELRHQNVGYVCREERIENLYDAIEKLDDGELYLSSKLRSFLKKSRLEKQKSLFGENLVIYFTPTELIVLREIGKCKKSTEIAEELHKSIHTVNNHKKNIIRKLTSNGKIRLLKFCIENIDAIRTLIALDQHREKVLKLGKYDQK